MKKSLYDSINNVTPSVTPPLLNGVTGVTVTPVVTPKSLFEALNGVTEALPCGAVTPISNAGVTVGVTKTACAYCQELFIPQQAHQRFCQMKCRVAAFRQRQVKSAKSIESPRIRIEKPSIGFGPITRGYFQHD